MPVSPSPVPVIGSLVWLLVLALAAFVVSWVANRFRVQRTPYIGLLSVVTGVLTVGYVVWLGSPPGELVTNNWVWGLVVAPLCALPLIVGMRKQPVTHRLTGRPLVVALLWEGVVYSIAEGLLLSTLPVLMTWQMIQSLGWSGVPGEVAGWALPIAASVVVIVVHHLGYWEYRNRMLVPISVGCGLLSLGYLVTGSPIAPTLGHFLGHASGLLHGVELPPHEHPATQPRESVGSSTR